MKILQSKWITVRFALAYLSLGTLWLFIDHKLSIILIPNLEPTTLPHFISDVLFLIVTGASVFFLLYHWEHKRFADQTRLIENEKRLLEIFEHAPIAYHSLDENAKILIVNETWLEMLGYNREEVSGKWIGDFLTDESRPTLFKNFPVFLDHGRVENVNFQMIKKDGSVIHINLSGKISTDLDGNFKQTHCVFRDVTSEFRISNSLKESEEKYRSVINNTMDGIFVLQDRKLVFCNQRFSEILGASSPENLLDVHLSKYIMETQRVSFDDYMKRLETGKEQKEISTFSILSLDQQKKQVEVFSHLIFYNLKPAIQGTLRDVSEQESLKRQLSQSQKMEAVGRLASGVAHDFNNLLTAIIGSAELAKLNMEKDVFDQESLDEILATSKKGAELTRQLLAFSRKDIVNPVILNLNETINNLDVLFLRLLTEVVSISFDLDPKLWNIKADTNQLEQVLVNLVINARDAMPNGGKLSIKTENVTLENQHCRVCQGPFSGNFVKVTVSDNGMGIKDEDIPHIFEPFYTTKEKQKGTGLGLATVYGVIKNSGGHIDLESSPGNGTSFSLFFPYVKESLSIHSHESLKTTDSEGTETILVIEDEEEVRKTTVRSLKQFGYTVFESESGKNGLDLIKSLGDMVDLVLSDIVMPEMDGVSFVQQALEIKPDLKAVFMSGYAPGAIKGINKIPDNIPLLKKPFKPTELAQMVRLTLDMKSQV